MRKTDEQRLLIACVLMFLPLFATSHVGAASFDCDEARTSAEKSICNNTELSSLDDKMDDAYKTLLAISRFTEGIKGQQRSWLKERDSCSDSNCLVDVYTRRLSEIQEQSLPEWIRIFRETKSESKRRKALIAINFGDHPDRQKFNNIGLGDPSPLVRERAVGFLSGDEKEFVPKLIKFMATDASPEIRFTAADSLSHWYTDNGADGDATLITRDIDLVLSALDDPQTMRPVVEILGARYSGPTYLPCRMPKNVRSRVIKALQKTIKKAHGYASDGLREALDNTSSCK
jgi:uncharacterized protein